MSDHAAIAAQAVDIQNDRQHKGFIKVTLHVPAEIGAQLTDTLGWPTYTQPVPVALARLNPNAIKSGDAPGREVERNTDRPSTSRSHKPVAPDKRLAQRAGILCAEPLFRKWLGEISKMANVTEDEAAVYVREKCGVKSRSEIIPGTEAGLLFDELIDAPYAVWRHADEYLDAAE